MFHYKNLYNLFFESYPNSATDFLALSGFIGIDPIKGLKELPFNSKVIYGLFKENRRAALHKQLISYHSEKNQIFYPNLACHSKCYLWLRDGTPIKGLIGSANFSSNGLQNDYRESLLEVDQNQLFLIKGYIDVILNSSKICTEIELEEDTPQEDYDKEICNMVLYDPRTGETQISHGLNWGLAPTSNVRPDDACIPIRVPHIRRYPKLFAPAQPNPEKNDDYQKEIIEIVFDDDVNLKGRLEGTQPVDGEKFPKQIASYPHKDELGKYFRKRLNLESGQRITRNILQEYGRDTVDVSLLEEGVYFIDFSV